MAPLRHPGFRSFIGFMCFWHFAAMVGASFISLFLLKAVGMSLFQVLLLWACSWTGGAVFSRRLGLWAERFGNKPVLVLCTIFKSVLMLSLLVVPADPTRAFWFLLPVFMFDAALNTGFAISTNGFLLKHSPAENRTMFIASGTALAGIVGGATSIAAGAALSALGDWQVHWGGFAFGGFHLMFTISIVLRFLSVGLVARIQEPHVYETVQVVTSLIGVTPLRVIRYPIGLYRSISSRAEQALRSGPRLSDLIGDETVGAARIGLGEGVGEGSRTMNGEGISPPSHQNAQSGTRGPDQPGPRVPSAVALAAAVRWPSNSNRQVAAGSDNNSPESAKNPDVELARAEALE
jgi:MFS family permease